MRCEGEFKNRTHETSGCGTRFRIERDKLDGVRKKKRPAFLCEPLFLFKPAGRRGGRLALQVGDAAGWSVADGDSCTDGDDPATRLLLQDFALGGEDFYLAQV